MQHVELDDILAAPSMDVSLKTATELALEDQNSEEVERIKDVLKGGFDVI
jgi:hypothetical protein